jgi:hypothetical protein
MFIPAQENNDQPLQYQYKTTRTVRNHHLRLIPILRHKPLDPALP